MNTSDIYATTLATKKNSVQLRILCYARISLREWLPAVFLFRNNKKWNRWYVFKSFSQRLYLSLPPIREEVTQGQWPEGQIIVGIKGKEGRALAEDRTWLDYACHRPALCKVDLMSLAGHGPNLGPAHMPDFSLNWTSRSSALQGWQRCQWCCSPSRRWLSRSRGLFGFRSAFPGQCLLGSKLTAKFCRRLRSRVTVRCNSQGH